MSNVHELTDVSRIPPYDLEAEMGLIGCVLCNDTAFDVVIDKVALLAHHFADPAHQEIWTAIVGLVDRGRKPSVVAVKTFLERSEQLDEVGGTKYLARLVNCILTIEHAADMAMVVHETHIRRGMIEAGEHLISESYAPSPDETPSDALARHAAELDDLADTRQARSGGVLSDVMSDALTGIHTAHEGGGPVGIPSGLPALNAYIGGFHKGENAGICGRPGSGKSGFLATLAVDVAMTERKVLFVTLEDTPTVITQRMMARQSGVSLEVIRNNRLTNEQIGALDGVPEMIGSLPLWIISAHGMTGSEIRSLTRTWKRKMGGIDLAIYDHLMKISGPGNSPTEIVGRNSKIMSNIPAELDLAGVTAVQLNRSVEQRDNKRPMLSDLRQSGEIEEDLRLALGLYRAAYYAQQSKPQKKLGGNADRYHTALMAWEADFKEIERNAEVIVMKQSHGPDSVTAHVKFDGPSTSFYEGAT